MGIKRLNGRAQIKKICLCIAILIIIIGLDLRHADVPDLHNRKYATSPYALLRKAKLRDLPYEVISVKIDTADHSPLGIHVMYTYLIRFLDSAAFNQRVQQKWKVHVVDGIPERCWFSKDYMQKIRIIDEGSVETRACYDVDYYSYPY